MTPTGMRDKLYYTDPSYLQPWQARVVQDKGAFNMRTKLLFRACIVVGAAYLIASIALSGPIAGTTASDIDALSQLSPEAMGNLKVAVDTTYRVCALILIGSFASLVGLFFFWRPARVLFVASMALPVLLFPLAWWQLDSAWAIAKTCVEAVFSVAFIVVMHVSPVSRLFDGPPASVDT